MTLSAGEKIGGYEIVGSLGAGGMGEVYLARDTRLKREVAIKILPEALSRDGERLARFQREAEVLASLNHRHIAAIYDLVDFDPSPFLVLELVEGETLADRIQRDRIPIPEALRIATQIAEALEAAHEKGIIHRDVKPANIKITPGGTVKVLDFGLAKVREVEGGVAALSNSPTMMATSSGVMMGTAPYMSPEQANGRPADRSSDMWAFGCVLYEMLTGRRPFEGDTVSEIVAGILKAEPDWHRLPAGTPEGIRRLLRLCLRKERTLRFRDAGDARIEIEDAQTSPEQDGRATPIRPQRRERLTWASALALVALIAALIGVRAFRPAAIAPEARLEITTPPTRDSAMAISPDGLKIVFAARSAGQSQLWLRTLDSLMARPLPGTEGASTIFWSPDSRSIGFFADSKLKRMDIDGGSVQTLASAPAGLGGAWSRDGTILFSTNPGRPIVRIPASGSEPAAVTRFESPQQGSQSSPRFLSDDRHFLFFVTGRLEARGVYIGSLDGLDTKRLFDADTPAEYAAATGYLLFVREGRLLAQDFDPVRLEPKGDPVPVAEHVNGGTVLSASAAGPVVYRTPSPDSGQRHLVWMDRSGRERDRVVYPDTAAQGPSLSHDGRRVAVFRYVNGNTDIWSYDTERRTWDRVTFDSADDIYPLWSPDDSRIVFGSNRKTGFMSLYWKPLGAPPASEELLLSTSHPKFPMDWSHDGRFVLYNELNAKGDFDIWALPLDGTRTPFEVVQTEFNERLPQFSPDGKWIAYQSDRTGRFEIYVQPFPGPGAASPVSTDGGAQVRWNPNGKELFYIAPDDRLMAVPIRFVSNGKAVEPGTPLGLFTTNVGSTAINTNRQQYGVSPDGQSFVMNSVLGEASTSPITVILNWKPKR
jgi:eukaryotic-like serine/threonine-protein kinase